jgi:hypothetical protein
MANIYDQASLVMIPSGTKTSKIFSQKPVNGDGDFTFSRSTAATRVNADGNIEKETQNLLLQSNSFDTTWNTFTASITGGQTGYDNSSDAWLLDVSVANGSVYQSINQSNVLTASIYAKKGTANGIRFRMDHTSDTNVYVDLRDGSLSSSSNSIDINIQDAGNGWYRISVAFSAVNMTTIVIYPTDGNTASTAGSIYIQDAQLEQGLVARDYIETTTAAVEGGITDNVPRLDYTDSSCPSLLLEPSRTNKLTHSEYINTSTFNQTGGLTISNNYATSPEGVVNAAKIIPTAVNAPHHLRTSLATPDGYDIISCFVKADGYDYVQLASWATGADYINFDLTDGSIGSIGSSGPTIYDIEDYGNGWYRIYANVKASGGGVIGIGVVTSASAIWAEAFTGNGTDGILVWGAQLESNATYPTSLIPTYGTSVTRNADSCSKTGISSLIGQTEGTMYAEFEWEQKSGVYFISDLSTGSTLNEILVAIGNTADNRIRFQIQNSGVDQVSFNSGVISSGTHKVALAYKANDVVAYLDGVQIGTDTSCTIPATSRYAFERANGTLGYEGGIKQALLFKTRLSNEELAALTTI